MTPGKEAWTGYEILGKLPSIGGEHYALTLYMKGHAVAGPYELV